MFRYKDKLVSAMAEIERQVIETGAVERAALLPVIDFGWTMREKRWPLLGWVKLIREAWEARDDRRTMLCRKALAAAYADELLPERRWPTVELAGTVTKDGIHIITAPCPYCGKRHTHGAAAWGSRVPHCLNLPNCYGQYVLVPEVK